MASSRRSYYEDPFGRSPSGYRRQRSQSRGSVRQYTSRSQSRYRSPSCYRDRSASPSPRRGTSRSLSRYRSNSRYRDRSASPSPRGNVPSHRLRSRSPPSNYTTETPYERRRRLLAERVMSLETYQRLLRDPKTSWAKLGAVGSTPVPVPLHANETVGDYQQKFEFWLAQRNVTLESLQDDVMRERSFRCGYAQWRAQMAEKNASVTSYGPQWSRFRSSPSTRGRERGKSVYLASSPVRNVTSRGESQHFSSTGSARKTAGYYDTHRQMPNDLRENKTWCTTICERKWTDLDRRLKQLESIVARIGVPRGKVFDGTSVSHYERDTNPELAPEGSAQTFIDLTDDIRMERNAASLQYESKVDNEPFSVSAQDHPRSVEITPTYSDTNHEGEWETEGADKPTDQVKTDVELKIPPDLAILINGYNEFNGQVLMKQSEERKLVADLDAEDMGNSRTVTQWSQIYELRDIMDKEKNMRDAAVAAIILFNCVEKENEIGQEFQKVVASDDACQQDALHEKCAGIATKLQEKDTELERLHKQLQSLSSLTVHGERGEQEAQELSSKIGVERAAKFSLETERQKIFSRLMKSSPQIQAMVSEELADKFSTTVEKDMPVEATGSDGKV